MDAEKLIPADVLRDVRYAGEPGPKDTQSFGLTLDFWDETMLPPGWNSYSHRWAATGTEDSMRRLEPERRAYHEDLFRWEIIRKLETSKTWMRRERERLIREAFDP